MSCLFERLQELHAAATRVGWHLEALLPKPTTGVRGTPDGTPGLTVGKIWAPEDAALIAELRNAWPAVAAALEAAGQLTEIIRAGPKMYDAGEFDTAAHSLRAALAPLFAPLEGTT